MGFCGKCGYKLDEDIAFCPKCGASADMPARKRIDFSQSVRSGDGHKCPECGEVLPAFTPLCPSCGFELRAKQSLSSISDLSRQLDEIEAQRPKSKARKKRKERRDERLNVSSCDQRKVTLIQSFPIPNTKEDLSEFMLLASTNINPKAFAETADVSASERAVSRAWYSKMCQAYEKTRLFLKDDPTLAVLQARYEITVKAVKKYEKKTNGRQIAIAYLVMILIFVGIFVAAGISNAQRSAYRNSLSTEERLSYDMEQEEQDCKSDESTIRLYIKDGDYEKAENLVYALDYDAELSQERHEYWEKRKTDLLKTIDDAQTNQRIG